MKKIFSLNHSLELLAILITILATLSVLQTFIIGKHFVIPTMVLVLCVLFGNLARFGLLNKEWAKQILFWIFFILCSHSFFALFWAAEARPGNLFGAAFYPVYGIFFLSTSILCLDYARRNKLFLSEN